MTDSQRSFFGGNTKAPKAKAKALPKQVPLPAAPTPKLSPNAELLRARNLASVRNERAKMKIGELRLSEDRCECGGQRIGELVGVHLAGGQDWEWRCLECSVNL